MVEMRTQLAIERAGLVTLHLQPARRSSIPTIIRTHRCELIRKHSKFECNGLLNEAAMRQKNREES